MVKSMKICLYFCLMILLLTIDSGTNASDLSSVSIHGIISQGYIKSTENNYLGDTKDGTFEFNEMGINFTTELTDRLNLGMQMFAQDKGYFGNDNITIDWAFARYRFKDYFGLMAGRIKGPVGFYSEIRDIDSLRTFILLPQSVYMESLRELLIGIKGVGIYGDLPYGLSYKFLYGTGDSPTGYLESGVPLVLEGTTAILMSRNDPYASFMNDISYNVNLTSFSQQSNYSMGAVEWRPPIEGMRFMVSGAQGLADIVLDIDISSENNTLLQMLQIAGAERRSNTSVRLNQPVELNARMAVFSMEYIWQETTFVAEGVQYFLKVRELEDTLKPYGYYVSVSQRVTDWLGVGAYYSYQNFDPEDRNGKKFEAATGYPDYWIWFGDLCLAFQFDINMNWIAKAEAHLLDGIWQVDVFSDDKKLDYSRDWFMFCMKLSYSF